MEKVVVVEGRYKPWYVATEDHSCVVTKHMCFILHPSGGQTGNKDGRKHRRLHKVPSPIKTILALMARSHINRDLIWGCLLSMCTSTMSFTKELCNPLKLPNMEKTQGLHLTFWKTCMNHTIPFSPSKPPQQHF